MVRDAGITPIRAGLGAALILAMFHAPPIQAAQPATPPIRTLPTGAGTATSVQGHVSFGKIASTGGPVTLSTATDSLSGAGLLGQSGVVSRGAIAVTRPRRSTATAVVIAPPTSIACGKSRVGIHFEIDNSACATLAATPCTIFIGAKLTIPPLPAGTSCI